MKANKQYAIIALILSAVVFTGTAFADALLGTGYDNFKAAGKKTILLVDNDTHNHTIETSFTLKIDDIIIAQEKETIKVDSQNDKRESSSTGLENGMKERSRTSYRDNEMEISTNSEDDTYFVYKYNDDRYQYRGSSTLPDYIDDIEKIVDAAVGSLKNNIQYENTENGGKSYVGNVSDAEVPTLINAVSSFAVKQSFMSDYRMGTMNTAPKITDNISITGASGRATEDANGYIDSLDAYLGFTGSDEHGVYHKVTIDLTLKAYDIGTTVVIKPDLTGKKVEYATQYGSRNIAGLYKNDIVVESESDLVKLGESFLEISIDNDVLNGKFSQVYKDGRETSSFTFTIEDEFFHRPFVATDENGETVTLEMSSNGRNKLYVYFSGNFSNVDSMFSAKDFDSDFMRVLD